MTAEKFDVYSHVTSQIIAQIEAGTPPWRKPWTGGGGGVSLPERFNGEAYRGINILMLWATAMAKDYSSARWMTFNQAKQLGGHVRKGEKSATVVKYGTVEREDENGEERQIPYAKAYRVFNADQIDGLPEQFYARPAAPAAPAQRIAHADAFFATTGAIIRHGGDKAFFAPSLDLIQMPPFESFRDPESYYATLAHETVHWAGAEHRLNRDLSRYHSDRSERAREELIADLGACFVSADLGIVPELEPRADHASYLASWLDVLSNDKRFIFSAAAHAQRAVAYLHGLQPDSGMVREAA